MSNFITLEVLEGRPIYAEDVVEYRKLSPAMFQKLVVEKEVYIDIRKDDVRMCVTILASKIISGGNIFKPDEYVLLEHTVVYSEESLFMKSLQDTHSFLVAGGMQLKKELVENVSTPYHVVFKKYKPLRVVPFKEYKKLTKLKN